jgi:hypothetical protein
MLTSRRIVLAVCAYCAALALSAGLVACGDSSSAGDSIVARIDGNSITKATLDHWTDVEAVLAYEAEPKKPVPTGVIPDPPSYAKCIAYSKTTLALGGARLPQSRAQLKRQCEARRRTLQRHVLDILITYYWLLGEGTENGVKATAAEIGRVKDQIFPTAASFHRYLTLTGERPADERLIIEKDLLDTELLQLAEAKSKPKGEHEHERVVVEAARAFTNKWKARTSCSAGYVVTECKQYQGRPSLVAP